MTKRFSRISDLERENTMDNVSSLLLQKGNKSQV